MPEHIGPLNTNVPPYGEFTLNDQPITHHMDVIDLPQGDEKEVCYDHLRDGRAGDLMGEFMAGFCHFPEAGEDQMIRTAIVCSGPDMFKRCQLRLLQAKRDGEVITEVKYEG